MTESPDKSMINKYLLGDLPEKDQIAIEDAAFESEQQMQAIKAAEDDLIDDYVRGELSEHDRRLFEQRFFASPERRRKVEFAKAFALVAPEFPSENKVKVRREHRGIGETFGMFFRSFSPVPRFALAAVGLLLILGVAWLVAETTRMRSQLTAQKSRENQERILQQQVDQERARSEQLTAQLQREQQQREQAEQLLNQVKETPSNPKPESQPLIATLALFAGIPRGDAKARPTLQIQPGTRLVRLQVEVDPADEYKTFQIDLDNEGGGAIWSRAGLVAHSQRRGKVIVMTLPASIFKSNGYELTLKGVNTGGTTDDLGFYYFNAARK